MTSLLLFFWTETYKALPIQLSQAPIQKSMAIIRCIYGGQILENISQVFQTFVVKDMKILKFVWSSKLRDWLSGWLAMAASHSDWERSVFCHLRRQRVHIIRKRALFHEPPPTKQVCIVITKMQLFIVFFN